MNQDNEARWVRADRDAATRIVEQIVEALDLLLLIWTAVCPGCRQSTMTLLRERLPDIAAHAAELAELDDASSAPPACH